jgi:hypothetical protein
VQAVFEAGEDGATPQPHQAMCIRKLSAARVVGTESESECVQSRLGAGLGATAHGPMDYACFTLAPGCSGGKAARPLLCQTPYSVCECRRRKASSVDGRQLGVRYCYVRGRSSEARCAGNMSIRNRPYSALLIGAALNGQTSLHETPGCRSGSADPTTIHNG